MALYGRDDEVWDQLAQTGLEFLIERARLRNHYSQQTSAVARPLMP
jgi:hypothetical protein